MQDWTTVRGDTGGSPTVTQIIQGEDQWLDFSPFQDCVFFIDCREVTGSTSPSLAIETSPSRDDALFAGLVPSFTLSASSGPSPKIAFLLPSTTVPVARWVRWKLTAAGGIGKWDATFRIWACGIAPGA
jgi:hypothetical protein